MKRKLLMIPGPIEFEPEVMAAMSIPTPSHVAPDFIECFGHSLEMMKQVWMCPSGQPFFVVTIYPLVYNKKKYEYEVAYEF